MPTAKTRHTSPRPADLQQAADTLPDGPNVAPSPHEHEAAMGQLEPPAASADGSDTREHRIRSAAYALSAQRGFEPGRDVDDWLEAERQIDADGSSPSRA